LAMELFFCFLFFVVYLLAEDFSVSGL
jgi:hypothetical protein